MKINRWLYLSSSLWEIPLSCELFGKKLKDFSLFNLQGACFWPSFWLNLVMAKFKSMVKFHCFLRLREIHNALQLPVFLIFFCQTCVSNIGEFGSKKYLTEDWTANTIKLFVSIKRNIFVSILFLNESLLQCFTLDKFFSLHVNQ